MQNSIQRFRGIRYSEVLGFRLKNINSPFYHTKDKIGI